MSWLGDAWDWLGSSLSTSVGGKSGTPLWAELLPPALTAGSYLMAGLNSSQDLPYGSTEAGFGANLALEQEKLEFEREALAQAKILKEMEIEAAIKAAEIADGAKIKTARMSGAVSMAQMKDKAIADRIALRIQGRRGEPELRSQAANSLVNAYLTKGQLGQQGFMSAGSLLQGFRR